MILYRYIMKEQILPFLYTLSIIVFLFMMQLAVQLLRKMLFKGLEPLVIIELVLINLAWMVVLSVPMATLCTTLITFGRMSADNEILAIKASGQNLFTLTIPVFIASFILTTGLIFFHNLILPDANHRSASLQSDIARKKPATLIEPNILITSFEHYAFMVNGVENSTGKLTGVKIYSTLPNEEPTTTVADSGLIQLTKDEKYLQLTLYDGETHSVSKENKDNYFIGAFKKHIIYIPNVDSRLHRTERVYRGDREQSAQSLLKEVKGFEQRKEHTYNTFEGELTKLLGPGITLDSLLQNDDSLNHELIDSLSTSIDTINSFAAWQNLFPGTKIVSKVRGIFHRHQRYLERTLQDINRQERKISQFMVEVHKKFSTSFACIVFVLLGVPLGITARQGNMAVGVSYSIFFFLLFWIFLIGGERLADRLIISPAVAMWSCNVIIGTCGIVLIINMIRETTFINYGPLIRFWHSLWNRRKSGPTKSVKQTVLRSIIFIPRVILNFFIGTLPAYLIRKFLANMLAVFTALVIIFVVVDYISNLRKFETAHFIDVLWYYWYYLAWFLQLIFPIGILLASMFSMTSMAKYNEITAIKASGMSVRRLTMPLLTLGLFLSFFNFFLGEKIIPNANAERNELKECFKTGKRYNRNKKNEIHSTSYYRDLYYFANKNTAYRFRSFRVATQQGQNVRRERFRNNRIIENVIAEKMVYTQDKQWLFINGEVKSFNNYQYKLQPFDTLTDSVLTATPEEMVVPIKSIDYMSYWELKDLLDKAEKRGEKIRTYQADLHFKIALPFMNFIVILLGLSITARVGRKGGTVSFGIGLALVFSYWILSQFILALGKNETLNPAIAAWFGNILYLVLGLVLYRRASR